MKDINNNDIVEYTGKSYSTIAGWSSKQPKLIEVVKLGSFCKKNNLDIDKIKKLIAVQDMIKDNR
ncbi:MAG: hypothetical protein KAQ94_05955 [Arcobacteraceae bacterium]|nr:hypothetical protein [Arcobacteraceae bacterium]